MTNKSIAKVRYQKTEIAKQVGIARSTLYDELNKETVEQLDSNLKIHKEYFAV